jgi:hypothetical protein
VTVHCFRSLGLRKLSVKDDREKARIRMLVLCVVKGNVIRIHSDSVSCLFKVDWRDSTISRLTFRLRNGYLNHFLVVEFMPGGYLQWWGAIYEINLRKKEPIIRP